MEPELAIGSVPVSIAAKAYGKDGCLLGMPPVMVNW